MRIGSSLLIIALGAILKFAIADQQTHGVNLSTIGIILMVVGAVGLVISLMLLTTRRRTDVRYRHDGATYVEPRSVDPIDEPRL